MTLDSPELIGPQPDAGLRARRELPPVAVVIGSTRPTRICADIAAWVRDEAQRSSALRYELLDLAAMHLPFLDEPLMGSLHQYAHEHTRAWSRLVSSFAGFLFVFPQYNWGYPAVLKNAIDYLYDEWRDKPASLLSYGTRGGNRAARQFAEVLHGVHLHVLDEHIEAAITHDDVDADWQLTDVASTLRPVAPRLRTIDAQFTEVLTARWLRPATNQDGATATP